METIADSIPVTKQAYRNLGFVAGEIDNLLSTNLSLRVDLQLYSGDGNTPNLKGIKTFAVAMGALPTAASPLGNGNLYDLIASLRVYISNGVDASGKQGKYNADFVLLNPADILRYKLLKAIDGHYLLPPFISVDGTRIDNVLVVESAQVTANTLVLGDSRYATIYHEEDVTVTVGLIDQQFIKNQWTILAEQVMCLLVRTVDVDAFVYCSDIAAAILTI